MAIGVLSGIGGYLNHNGIDAFGWLGRRNGEIAPVAIADSTKTYSIVQRAQLERPDELPMPHGDAELADWAAHYDDKTYVPPSVSYVRVEYLASAVEKPYPKIFFADQSFPTDTMMLENVAIVKPAAMVKILSSAENLSCDPNSAVSVGRTDQVEILIRSANKTLKRCLLSIKAGCKYMTQLSRLTHEIKGNDSEYLPELESRLACPTSSWPWDRSPL